MFEHLNDKYYVWDPSFAWFNGKVYGMALTCPRIDDSERPFWNRCHSVEIVQGGKTMCRLNTGYRLCAGSLVAQGEHIYAYLSETHADFGNFHLGQRGLWFKLSHKSTGGLEVADSGVIEPDPCMFNTNRYGPDSQKLFGCRDPYSVFQGNGKHYLYFVSGGARWGVPVAVHVASGGMQNLDWTPGGLLDPRVDGIPALYEYERVSVLRSKGRWIMIGSCWKGWVNDHLKVMVEGMGERVTDSVLWVMESDRALGPYRLSRPLPFIINSSKTGTFGLQFKQIGDTAYGMGWNLKDKTVQPKNMFRLDTNTLELQQDNSFALES